MALTVAHNLSAINANKQSKLIEGKRAKITEKLSSGYRINRAADDASGLAISEKMLAQIRGLTQASHNIQDGISYVQTADGALEEVHSIFQRIRELSIQSSNGTNTSFDRLMLDLEIDELKDNAERIFKDTEFNTQKIWDGEPLLVDIIVGTADVPAVSTSYASATSTITNTNRLIMPKNDGFRLDTDADGIRISWNAYDGNTYTSELIEWEEPITGTHSFHLEDYLNTVTYIDKATNTICMADPRDFEGLDFEYTYTVAETAVLDDVVTALDNAYVSTYISTPESAKTFTIDGSELGTTADGKLFSASCSASISYDALLVSDRDFEASDTAYIEGIKNQNGEYENVSNPVTKNTPSEAFEFEFLLKTGTDTAGNDIFTKVKAQAEGSTHYYCASYDKEDKDIWWHTVVYNDGTTSDFVLSHYSTPACSPDSISSAYSASYTNKTKSETLEEANKTHPATLTYSFRLVAENKFICEDGRETDYVGSLSITLNVPPNNGINTADKINEALGKLTGLDIYSGASPSYLHATASRWDSANKLEIPTYESCYEYAKQIDIQAGANEGQIIPISYGMLSLSLLDIEDLQVDTFDNAQDALIRIDNAIKTISEQRSLFGAYQNRLEHAKAINDNTIENLQTAESKIRDADMAFYMVEYSKMQILSQTTQAMLAQANQSKQGVLELLQQ